MKMKKISIISLVILIIIILICIFLFTNKHQISNAKDTQSGQVAKKTDFIGYWKSDNGKNIIKITEDSGKYTGTIVWLKDPLHTDGKPLTDGNNPDKINKENPIIGLKILQNFILNKDNELDEGKVYDPESGNTYSGIVKIEGNNLNVRGYIGTSLLGRTEVWHKISNQSDLPSGLEK
ncbi:MAG TPA: DUF2147 domain-containing protein [Victivallales bacterium]|nr:DUF2147 domain-containing protein [Victivallales bacterium]